MSKTTPTKPPAGTNTENPVGTVAARALARSRRQWPKGGFPPRGSIERLAALQAVKLERQFQKIFGTEARVWSTEKEFQQTVEEIYERRRADRASLETLNPVKD